MIVVSNDISHCYLQSLKQEIVDCGYKETLELKDTLNDIDLKVIQKLNIEYNQNKEKINSDNSYNHNNSYNSYNSYKPYNSYNHNNSYNKVNTDKHNYYMENINRTSMKYKKKTKLVNSRINEDRVIEFFSKHIIRN